MQQEEEHVGRLRDDGRDSRKTEKRIKKEQNCAFVSIVLQSSGEANS